MLGLRQLELLALRDNLNLFRKTVPSGAFSLSTPSYSIPYASRTPYHQAGIHCKGVGRGNAETITAASISREDAVQVDDFGRVLGSTLSCVLRSLSLYRCIMRQFYLSSRSLLGVAAVSETRSATENPPVKHRVQPCGPGSVGRIYHPTVQQGFVGTSSIFCVCPVGSVPHFCDRYQCLHGGVHI